MDNLNYALVLEDDESYIIMKAMGPLILEFANRYWMQRFNKQLKCKVIDLRNNELYFLNRKISKQMVEVCCREVEEINDKYKDDLYVK